MSLIRHPFEVESTDHCETPFSAYRDVAPVLIKLAELLGKSLSELKIYECDRAA